MSDEISIEADKIKVERIVNRILDIFRDENPEDVERFSQKKGAVGEIETVMVLIIGDSGYRRLQNELMNPVNYMDALTMEVNRISKAIAEHVLTGRTDFRDEKD